jgi:hypothetical protein
VVNPVANNKGGTEFLGQKSGSFPAWLLGDKRPRLAAGPDGLLVTMHNVFGKDGGYNGPWYTQAIFLDAEGKFKTPTNKESLPQKTAGEGLNPGWVMEPVPDPFGGKFGGTPWNPTPAALGKDWLVVLQKRTVETRPGHPLVLRDDIIAARVLADGSCPDRASPLMLGSADGPNTANPAVCSGPEGEVLVVYERQKAAGDLKVAARVVKK